MNIHYPCSSLDCSLLVSVSYTWLILRTPRDHSACSVDVNITKNILIFISWMTNKSVPKYTPLFLTLRIDLWTYFRGRDPPFFSKLSKFWKRKTAKSGFVHKYLCNIVYNLENLYNVCHVYQLQGSWRRESWHFAKMILVTNIFDRGVNNHREFNKTFNRYHSKVIKSFLEKKENKYLTLKIESKTFTTATPLTDT